jgi:hypothetical protein
VKKTQNKNLSKIIIPISVVLVIAIVVLIIRQIAKGCKGLDCITMESLDNYQIGEIYEDSTQSYRAMLVNRTDTNKKLRVEIKSNVTSAEANKITLGLITQMKTVYANARSPYPGEITDEIICPDNFKPIFGDLMTKGSLKVTTVEGFLTSRLVSGGCTEEQVDYRELMGVFYCLDQRKLYQVELITDKKRKLEGNILNTINCK